MNKKEFLRSINNIDDKLLREGEEFFTPAEAERDLSVYRKKGISLKPLISAAACCAVVIAAAVFAGSLRDNMPESLVPNSAGTDTENTADFQSSEQAEQGVDIDLSTSDSDNREEQGEKPENTKQDAEGTGYQYCFVAEFDIDEVSIDGSSVEIKEGSSRFVLNITEPVQLDLKPFFSAKGDDPVSVRISVLKNGEPAKFSALGNTDVTYVDTVIGPDSEKEIPISLAADQNDDIITVAADFDSESDKDDIYMSFINLSCEPEKTQFARNCTVSQTDKMITVDMGVLDNAEEYIGYSVYVDDQVIQSVINEDQFNVKIAENGSFVVGIPTDKLKSGDVIRGAFKYGSGRTSASFKVTVE